MNRLVQVGRWMRKHPQFVLSISIVLMGVILGVILQDALFMDFLVVMEGLMLLTPITIVLGVVVLVCCLVKRPVGNFLRYALVVGVASILSLVCLWETASLIDQWEVNAVETYVLHAVPILDRIKAETQSYPGVLPIDLVGEPPSLLRADGSYTATKDTFCFEYINEPAGWAGGEGLLKFESSTRKWVPDQ